MLMGVPVAETKDAFDWNAIFSLLCGMALTLIVSGYQFGRGNHTVYLLDAVRELHPQLLAGDWFVTHTLQYHAVFSALTALLMKLGIVQPAFLVGYLLLVVMWHLAWRGIAVSIGADDRTYLLSVVFYYLSAAGISIGVFQFLQDACFLPSNVANIAMLWGIYQWMLGRRLSAGIWLGIAGLFHVNFAAMTIGLWTALVGWRWFDQRNTGLARLVRDPILWWSTAAAFVPSLFNLSLAIPAELRRGGTMPMGEFVRVYVRFRHAHHFDPLHWPVALWLSFLWPIPFAVLALSNSNRQIQFERQQATRFFLIVAALLVIAFLFAGVWFANEPLVQLCLWRFSIFTKMFSCIGAAWFAVDYFHQSAVSFMALAAAVIAAVLLGWFWKAHDELHGLIAETAWAHRAALLLIVIMLMVISMQFLLGQSHGKLVFQSFAGITILLSLGLLWPSLGVGMTPEPEDPNYRAVCAWARQSTPIDADFVVPPEETDFRLYAQRAIIVNYKHVPQLSGEIIQWRQRLLDVLGLGDLSELPQDYTRTMRGIETIYERRPAGALIEVARNYQAQYIVVDHALTTNQAAIIFHSPPNPFYVYELLSEKKNQ